MLGIRTRGRRMVGADETTELWRPPNNFYIISVNAVVQIKRNLNGHQQTVDFFVIFSIIWGLRTAHLRTHKGPLFWLIP